MATLLLANVTDPNELTAVRVALEHQTAWKLEVIGPDKDVVGEFNRRRPDLAIVRLASEPSRTQLVRLISDVRAISVPVVLLLPDESWRQYLPLLHLAEEYVLCPFRSSELQARVGRWLNQGDEQQIQAICNSLEERYGVEKIIGTDPVFLRIKEQLPLIAKSDATVMITGETGTGKEVFARALHYLSRRARFPFISINCGAVPIELFESELFGHRRGAFTGAVTSTRGYFADAGQGTLFLDEVDAMPLAAQVKLLHVLQDRSYRQLGGGRMVTANARVIAASNVDLEVCMRRGSFRADLYYRLNIIPIQLPPLRERSADIPLLAKHFLAKHVDDYATSTRELTPEALRALAAHAWPGNIRELENVIQRAVVLCPAGPIDCSALMRILRATHTPADTAMTFREAKKAAIAKFEQEYARRLLVKSGGNITRAARAAKIDRRAFGRIVKKYDLKPEPSSQVGPRGGPESSQVGSGMTQSGISS